MFQGRNVPGEPRTDLILLNDKMTKKTQDPSKDPGANKFEEAPALQEGKIEF